MDDNVTQIVSLLITSITTIAVAWFKLHETRHPAPAPPQPPTPPPAA